LSQAPAGGRLACLTAVPGEGSGAAWPGATVGPWTWRVLCHWIGSPGRRLNGQRTAPTTPGAATPPGS